MTTQTKLTATQLEAFDEFVQLIGVEDRWTFANWRRQRGTYGALVLAGLLERRLHYPLAMYGLTETGLREVCHRDGQHDHDRNRPASDGCQTCDATLCLSCEGYGSISDATGQRDDVRCGDCRETGLLYA